MSQKRLSMRKIRELRRLKYELGRNHREIAASLGIANRTVSDYVRRVRAAGFSWPLPEGLDDAAPEVALFPAPPPSRVPGPEPDWGHVHRELQRHKGVTLQLLWLESRFARCSDPVLWDGPFQEGSLRSTRMGIRGLRPPAGLKPIAGEIRRMPPFASPKREGRYDQTSRNTGGDARSQVDPPPAERKPGPWWSENPELEEWSAEWLDQLGGGKES